MSQLLVRGTVGQGWTATRELLPGDILIGRNGERTPVEEVFATEAVERVYNFRIAEYHTYYVGDADWGFSVWAHNLCRWQQMEARAKNVADARGEKVIETQWAVNPNTGLGRGFDFASVVGWGSSARLILNEVKSNQRGILYPSNFTAFGLGRGGSRIMDLNLEKARIAILGAANIDDATRAALIQQIQDRSFAIRIIARRSLVSSATVGAVQSETGVSTTLGF